MGLSYHNLTQFHLSCWILACVLGTMQGTNALLAQVVFLGVVVVPLVAYCLVIRRTLRMRLLPARIYLLSANATGAVTTGSMKEDDDWADERER